MGVKVTMGCRDWCGNRLLWVMIVMKWWMVSINGCHDYCLYFPRRCSQWASFSSIWWVWSSETSSSWGVFLATVSATRSESVHVLSPPPPPLTPPSPLPLPAPPPPPWLWQTWFSFGWGVCLSVSRLLLLLLWVSPTDSHTSSPSLPPLPPTPAPPPHPPTLRLAASPRCALTCPLCVDGRSLSLACWLELGMTSPYLTWIHVRYWFPQN